jgi:dCMP deaminase
MYNTMDKWDLRFMNLAKETASWSKDLRTKVGSVIVRDKNPISLGFNGLPVNCNDEIKERFESPQKYMWTIHSEANSLVQAAKHGVKTEGCAMYVTLFPCANCAGLIVNGGIKKLVCENKPNLNDERWGENWKTSLIIFEEGGVEVIYMNYDAHR